MTSTTLTSKNTFAPAFRKSAKKGLGDMIAVSVLAIIVPVFALIVTFYNNIFAVTYKTEYDVTMGALIVLAIMTVTCAAFSLFVCPKLFKEIYKKQSCDLYFSLPIKRENYFFASYLFGAIINIAALILPTIIYSSLMLAMSTKYVLVTIEWGTIFRVLIPVVIALLTAYTSFIMCAVISGRRIHYYLLALVCVYATSTGLSGILTTINTIWGFTVKSALPLCIDPYMNAVYSAMTESLGMRVLSCAIMVVEIIAMLAAGTLIFKRRRAEVAEVTITGKVVPYIILAFLALAGYMRYCANTPILAIIAGCILAVLLTMAFTGIFYKKVFTKQTGITVAAVCVACTLLIGVVNLPAYSSYVKKLPQASEVESIEISNGSSDEFFTSTFYSIIETFSIDIDGFDSNSAVKITGDEAIAATVKLHEKLIDDKVIKKSKNYSQTALISLLFDAEDFFEGDYSMLYDISLTYHLKSGKTITRTYSVDGDLILDEYYELAKTDEMINNLPSLSISEDRMLSLNVYTNGSDYYYEDDYYYDQEGVGILDSDDYEEDDTYIDEYLKPEHWTNIKSAFVNDLKKMEKDNFLIRFNELNNYRGITNHTYVDGYYSNAVISLMYLKDNTPENVAKDLKSMTPEQLRTGYDNYTYSDYDYAYLNGEKSDLSKVSKYAFIETSDIYVYDDNEEVFNYFKSIGLNF